MAAEWCLLVLASGEIDDAVPYSPLYEDRYPTVIRHWPEAEARAINESRFHADDGPRRWRWDSAQVVEVADARVIITITAHGTEPGLDMPAVQAGAALRLAAVATDAHGDPLDITGRHWVRVLFNERRWVVGVDFTGSTADVQLPVQHPGQHSIESYGAAHILRGDVEFIAVVVAPPYSG